MGSTQEDLLSTVALVVCKARMGLVPSVGVFEAIGCP